ncbi:hypothetical protein [Neorhizobium galegae]|nr:hypothetical protein [Neorhizobium galegae]
MGWKFKAWFRASHKPQVSRRRPKLKATQHMAISVGKRKPEEWFCGSGMIAEGGVSTLDVSNFKREGTDANESETNRRLQTIQLLFTAIC